MTHHKPLPDAICQRSDEGFFILAANKLARSALNKGLEKPRPSWQQIARVPDGIIHSPEYRALIVANGRGSVCDALLTAQRRPADAVLVRQLPRSPPRR